MKKEIIINSTVTETRIALLEDDVLVNLFVERPEHERNVGDVYKGTVHRVMPGMQAAFVNIGWDMDGFIHFSDLFRRKLKRQETGRHFVIWMTYLHPCVILNYHWD